MKLVKWFPSNDIELFSMELILKLCKVKAIGRSDTGVVGDIGLGSLCIPLSNKVR